MKCNVCNNDKTVAVQGIFDEPLEIPCSCQCDKLENINHTDKLISQNF